MKKIVKKIFLPTMISATILASLTGCGKDKKEVKEPTSEINVDENVKLALTDEEVKENNKNNIAEKTYNEYKEFYEDASVTKEEVIKMVDVINGDVQGYSEDEIKDALALVKNMLLSNNTKELLNNCNLSKAGQLNEEIEFRVIRSPKVSDVIVDEDDKENIIKYEELRDELIEEIIKNGNYSEGMVTKINEAIIEQETSEYNSYNDNMSSSLNNEGTEYAITAAHYQLCNLGSLVNVNTSVIIDDNGNEYQLNPKSEINEKGYIEADVEAMYWTLNMNDSDIPEDILVKYNEIQMKLISTKYFQGLCTLSDQLLTKAGYIKTSMLELQKQKKELLIQKQIELALKENEIFEGYNLTLNM